MSLRQSKLAGVLRIDLRECLTEIREPIRTKINTVFLYRDPSRKEKQKRKPFMTIFVLSK